MVQTRAWMVCVTLCFSLSTPLVCKRRSKIKKADRVEQKKKVVVPADQSMSTILSKQTKNMTFQEASRAKEYYLKEKSYDMVLKCGQRLLAVAGDQEIMRVTRLELAHIFLDKKNYAEAEKYAEEYQKHYPGTIEAKQAEYICLRANFLSMQSSDREQSKTRATIKLGQEYLDKYSQDTEYKEQVHKMLRQAYQTLIRSEINIINTQLNTYHYTKKEQAVQAAQKRLDYIKEQYLPHAPSTHKRLDELELQIAQIRKPSAPQAREEKNQKAPERILMAKKKEPLAKSSSKRVLDTLTGAFFENNDEYFA